MKIITCDGCRRRIADDDLQAARRLPLGGEQVDWCGDCVTIVRAELPRVVSAARAARSRAAMSAGDTGVVVNITPDPRTGQRILSP